MVVRTINMVYPEPNGDIDIHEVLVEAGINLGEGGVGPTGPQGPQGPQGVRGPTGPQGLSGSDGPRGLTGPQGEPGPIGPTGEIGPEGPRGVQGLQGPRGFNGKDGEDGAPGPQGPRGYQGNNGIGWLNQPDRSLFSYTAIAEVSGGNGEFLLEIPAQTLSTIEFVGVTPLAGNLSNADVPIGYNLKQINLSFIKGKVYKASSAGLLAAMQQIPADNGTKVMVEVKGTLNDMIVEYSDGDALKEVEEEVK